MAINGVDISSYQPHFTPSNEEFLFAKATEGTSYINPYHDAQIKRARDRGLVVGHYHWIHPNNIKGQAAYFVKHAKVRKGDILVCDWEQPGVTNKMKNDFIAEVKRLAPDNRVILYCNVSWWNGSDKKAGDGLWIAHYTSASKPGISDDWVFWQYTQTPIDKNRSTFKTKAELKAWAEKKPAPSGEAKEDADKGLVHVLMADGVPIDTSAFVAADKERIPFRGGLTCSCVIRSIALVEARMKAAGVIKECVDFWQLGYRTDVSASAGTHAGGGAVDVNQFSDKAAEIWRECGWAFWTRTPSQGFMWHGHGILIGCPHVSSGARSQVNDYRIGLNGLANRGHDDGPDVKYISWRDAWDKFVKDVAKPATDDTEEDDYMAKRERIAERRSVEQGVKKVGTYQPLWISDKGNSTTFAYGPVEVEGYINLVVSGLKPEDTLYFRTVAYDYKGKQSKRRGSGTLNEIHGGGGGWLWGPSVPFIHVVGSPAKGYNSRRLRFEWTCTNPKVKIERVEISGYGVKQ